MPAREATRWGAWTALFAALFVACSAVAEAPARPNVLFLTIDTLRADHLGCYGYPRNTSPTIDALAKEGVVFEDTTCEVPLTSPSFGAMLTSRPPRLNGSTRNGLRLPEDTRSVVQIFKEAGYSTFCVQSNWTLKAKLSGIERGFDSYDDDFHDKRWGIIKPEREGSHVTELALAQLKQQDPAKPFFGWVHYSDPHAPYKHHQDFKVWKESMLQLDKVAKVRAKYDSEIRFVDTEIAKILAALPPNTAVVLVSDHGESLYEHDYLGHGRRIYQDNMHIAFVVRAPGLAPGRLSSPVRGLDVGPTLLGLAGLQKAPGMIGLDALREPVPNDRIRVFETYGGAVLHLPGAKAVLSGRPPMRQGIRLGPWKLIVDGKREELYHLPDDPGELKDLAKANPSQVEELRGHLDAWEKEHPRATEKEEELTEDDRKALEAFGYLK